MTKNEEGRKEEEEKKRKIKRSKWGEGWDGKTEEKP